MRTIAKIFLFSSFISILYNGSASAASPFEIILGGLPDIAVTDIHQETRFVYMRVCNLGGSIADSDTSIALAMKKSGGGVISMVEPVIMTTNECHEFRVASVDELGITASGPYDISAGALLKDGRGEKTTDNNKITRRVNIVYPSTYTPVIQSTIYRYPSSDNYYCNASNNYCSGNTYGGSTTYYCIPGTSNCSTVPYSNNYNTSYCNASNNYCSSTSSIYYRANICPTWDVACNNSFYNSTNTQYRNIDNQYCTYANQYCNNYDYNRQGSTSYCNPSNNYCNYYNYNHNYDYKYNQPDLVVQRVYQNSSDKHIIAQICNQGGDMNSSVSVRTDFVSSSTTATMYNTLQIGHGQCTSTVVYTIPAEVGIFYNGNYSIGITVDSNNAVSESNESNNTLTQSLYIETDRNQKSDLVVDRISANDNNRTIMAHVCNIGDDMLDYNNWVMEVSNITNSTTVRNSGYRLSRGQCTDVSTSYASLGIYRSGGYNFRVVLDPDNAISEQSRWNNTLTQYLQIWMSY